MFCAVCEQLCCVDLSRNVSTVCHVGNVALLLSQFFFNTHRPACDPVLSGNITSPNRQKWNEFLC